MDDLLLTTTEGISLPDKVCKLIIEAILRGEFAVDNKLPTEFELTARYAVSRTTIREALSRLRSEGIVESRRGSGSYILRMPGRAEPSAPSISSIADVERYYAFRLCVEAGAAGLAAQMRTDADIASIHAAYRALDRRVDGAVSGVDADLELHLSIARASHNPFFIATIEHGLAPIRQCMELARNLGQTQSHARFEQVQAEHQAIIDGIEAKASEEASAAMRRHIENSRRRIFEGA